MPIYSRLQGKTVLITGASSGIGEACAREFAAHGSHLILAARRGERLEALRRDIIKASDKVRVHTHALDVRDREAIGSFIAGIPADFKNVDILINNAGLALGWESLETTAAEAVEAMIDTNVKGLLYMTKATLPLLRASTSKAPMIINVGSIAGHQAYPSAAVYCASKHAVHAISQALRMELVGTPIRVAEIMPGLVETEFAQVRFSGNLERAKSVYAGMTPLGGQDVAEIAAFVASRPDHVQIGAIECFPTSQASVYHVHRSDD